MRFLGRHVDLDYSEAVKDFIVAKMCVNSYKKQPSPEPKVKSTIPMHELLETSKCEKCGTIIAESEFDLRNVFQRRMMIDNLERQMTVKTLSTRTLGIIGLLSGASALFLLIFPYYYFLGRQEYIPKKNPDFGYFLPKSLEAWLFLILAISFLAFSMVALVFFIQGKKSEGATKPEQRV